MTDCVFCKIVAGEIPADIVASNEGAVAFRDVNPATPVHLLVVPRRHIASVDALGDDDGEAMAACLRLVRDAARQEGVGDRGFRVVCNTGADAGQVVQHIHFHVLGGRRLGWPPG